MLDNPIFDDQNMTPQNSNDRPGSYGIVIVTFKQLW